MSIYTPSHWSVFSFCGLLGFDSDLYLGGGDGWARRSSNGVDASNPKAATGSFSGSAAGAKCVCCVENMGDVDADDRGLRPHWLRERSARRSSREVDYRGGVLWLPRVKRARGVRSGAPPGACR